MNPKPLNQLTENDFRAYRRVQEGGRFNMITEANHAALSAGLTLNTYFGVIQHYGELLEKYGEQP